MNTANSADTITACLSDAPIRLAPHLAILSSRVSPGIAPADMLVELDAVLSRSFFSVEWSDAVPLTTRPLA